MSKQLWKDGAWQRVYDRLKAKYGEPFSMGSTRIVFLSKHCVVKFPRHPADNSRAAEKQDANSLEYQYYKQGNHPSGRLKKDNLARVKLLVMEDIPICIMEKVNSWCHHNTDGCATYVREEKRDQIPEWAKGLRDVAQVGENKKGKLVLFDYAE